MTEPIFTADLVHPSNIDQIRQTNLSVKMLTNNKSTFDLGTWIVNMTLPMAHPVKDNATLFLHEAWNISNDDFNKKFEIVHLSGTYQTHAIVVQK